MMKAALLISILLCFCLAFSAALEERRNHLRRDTSTQNGLCHLLCHIDVIGFHYLDEEGKNGGAESNGDDLYLCRVQNDAYKSRTGYRITFPTNFLELYQEELASARASVCISDGHIDRQSYKIIIEEGAELTLVSNRRQLANNAPTAGIHTVLAVHLSSSYYDTTSRTVLTESPGLDTTQIQGTIFGIGSDAPGHDLLSQYRDCSFGALQLVPATGTNIVNGVAEVTLHEEIAGGEILGSLQDDILTATEKVVGSVDQYTHIIFCMPDDATMDGSTEWTAFTYFQARRSFFQKRRCSAMSVTSHEMGHNLGFRHSGLGSDTYGDMSGYMGYTIYETGAPLKCFNGHKLWLSGWFQDRAYNIDPSVGNPVLKRVVAFADYGKTLDGSDVVLLRVGQYFIQYNRAKGINVGTGTNADKVTITYAKGATYDSLAIAGLSAGNSHTLPGFGNTGSDLVIEVCQVGTVSAPPSSTSIAQANEKGSSLSLIDFAWVSVHLDNGNQQSQCNQLRNGEVNSQSTARPTSSAPSPSPTTSPTSFIEETSLPTPGGRTSNTFAVVANTERQQTQTPREKTAGAQVENPQKKRQFPDRKYLNKLSKGGEGKPANRKLRL